MVAYRGFLVDPGGASDDTIILFMAIVCVNRAGPLPGYSSRPLRAAWM